MQAFLKTLVIGMGLAIAAGMGLLIYGFVKTTEDPNWRLFSKSEDRPVAPAVSAPVVLPLALEGDIALGLPKGCEIRDVRPAGGKLLVLTQPAGVCGQVLVVDPQAGRVTGRLLP